MQKLSAIAAIGALAVALAAPVPGFAQGANTGSIVMAPDHSMSAKSLIGIPVYNEHHEKIGTIETVMLKPDATEPVAVLSVGDYLGTAPKMVGVPMSHLQLQGSAAMMMPGATKEMLENLPGYSVTGG